MLFQQCCGASSDEKVRGSSLLASPPSSSTQDNDDEYRPIRNEKEFQESLLKQQKELDIKVKNLQEAKRELQQQHESKKILLEVQAADLEKKIATFDKRMDEKFASIEADKLFMEESQMIAESEQKELLLGLEPRNNACIQKEKELAVEEKRLASVNKSHTQKAASLAKMEAKLVDRAADLAKQEAEVEVAAVDLAEQAERVLIRDRQNDARELRLKERELDVIKKLEEVRTIAQSAAKLDLLKANSSVDEDGEASENREDESVIVTKRSGLSEKEICLEMAETELEEIMTKAVKEELDEPFEREAMEALKAAVFKLAYVKKYYDPMRDEIIYFPSVTNTLIDFRLIEEAEKMYNSSEQDEFPLEYSAALRSVAAMNMNDQDHDVEYMTKLAIDVE